MEIKTGVPPISEQELSDEAVLAEIAVIRKELGRDLIILAHHYQNDDIVKFADFSGDSLELAKKVKQFPLTPHIVFCGVHFMAETASMLSSSAQTVIIPDPDAGCFLADTAKETDVEQALDLLNSKSVQKIVPITYINSSAALKAIVGKNGGSICTSSNAEKVITWAMREGSRLMFFPDQHLGRNTCHKLGIPLNQMCLYDPTKHNGGLSESELRDSKVILWYGYCSVHQGFTTEQIDWVRQKYQGVRVIVHPECPFEVVNKADLAGSTSFILRQIQDSAPGTIWAVGTEINLVNRLASQFDDRKIISLSPFQCLCTTMYRIRPRWLLASLRAIKKGSPINVVKVPETVSEYALKALDAMLTLS